MNVAFVLASGLITSVFFAILLGFVMSLVKVKDVDSQVSLYNKIFGDDYVVSATSPKSWLEEVKGPVLLMVSLWLLMALSRIVSTNVDWIASLLVNTLPGPAQKVLQMGGYKS